MEAYLMSEDNLYPIFQSLSQLYLPFLVRVYVRYICCTFANAKHFEGKLS